MKMCEFAFGVIYERFVSALAIVDVVCAAAAAVVDIVLKLYALTRKITEWVCALFLSSAGFQSYLQVDNVTTL